MGSVGIEKLHVLAVDDSLVDRKVIERLLKISCCKVTAVESGIRALEFLGLGGDENKKMAALEFQELKVNLIMTDYSMPGMTGYELLKRIKESSACREIPVVIMSSENIMTRINSCLEEGAKDFLMKPVKLSDVERLRDVLMKGEVSNNNKVCKMQSEASPQVSSELEQVELTLASIPSTAAASSPASVISSPAAATAVLMPTLPPLFASPDLSCSLQHLSSPPSSPHWPSKRPRLLNRGE